MQLYKLPATLLAVEPEACKELNGIVANTFDKNRNAFLDKQGRIVSVVYQRQVSDELLWLVVMDTALPRLKAHLEKMLMFSSAKVQTLPQKVYFDLQTSSDLDVPERSGGLRLSEKVLPTSIDEATFLNFRLQHQIALQDIDYQNEMLLNLNDEELVSYTKGCFLGQEIIARVHYKSRPPRKLVVRDEETLPENLRGQMTSVVVDPQSGKRRGFVFIPSN